MLPKLVAGLMEELSEMLKSADVYLEVGDKAVESLRPVISKALRILLGALIETYNDLEPELEASSSLGAKAKRRDFTNYVKAGFTKEQAFTLVLASIKPVNFAEVLKSVNSSRNSSKSKSVKN